MNTNTPSIGSIMRQGAIAAVVGLLINVVLFFVGSAVGAFPSDFVVEQAGGPMTIGPVIVATLIGAVIGIVGYIVLSRFLSQSQTNRWFLILASIFLIISLAGPIGIPNSPPIAMIFFLELMHAGIGVPLMYFLIRS